VRGRWSQIVAFLNLSEVVKILTPFTSNSHLYPLHSAQDLPEEKEIQKVYLRKVLLAVAVATVVLVGAGVAYGANNSSSEEDADESYKGSVSVAGKNESSLQKLANMANIDEAAAEQVALKAVPGTVHETELETSDNGYLVYDIEIAGDDGKGHEVTVDAGNGKVLHQDLEEEADEADGPGDTEAADDGSDDTEDADDGASDKEDAD
jgi:uncharacterized membrane protein YkoI